jgi:hypothetical protein
MVAWGLTFCHGGWQPYSMVSLGQQLVLDWWLPMFSGGMLAVLPVCAASKARPLPIIPCGFHCFSSSAFERLVTSLTCCVLLGNRKASFICCLLSLAGVLWVAHQPWCDLNVL